MQEAHRSLQQGERRPKATSSVWPPRRLGVSPGSAPNHQIRTPGIQKRRPEPPGTGGGADRSRSRMRTPILQGTAGLRGAAAAADARHLHAARTTGEATHLHPAAPPAAQATPLAAARGRRPGCRGSPRKVDPPKSSLSPSWMPSGRAAGHLWRRRREGGGRGD